MFALRRDVVPVSGTALTAGNVRLRADKRPRPLVLRMNVGDCLRIDFQNLLDPVRRDQNQPSTRQASVHAIGLQLVGSIASDGSFVGQNASSLADPGQSRVYTYYGEREGEHVIYSGGATVGGQGDGGQINSGLFGAVIVEPPGALWYRSQLTRAEMDLVTTGANARGRTDHQLRAALPRRPSARHHPRPQHAGRPADRPHRPDRGDRRLAAQHPGRRPHRLVPRRHLPAQPVHLSAARPAVPRIRHHLPRRDRRGAGLPRVRSGALRAHPAQRPRRLRHQLRLGRHGRRDAGQPLRGRPDVGLHRVQVRGVLPLLLGGGRSGDGGRRAGQHPAAPTGSCRAAKATKAFFPDDPSNVYHSYLGDHISSGCSTPAPRSTTSTTCTPTSGSTRPTATSRPTSTARRSGRARPSPPRSPTTAAATQPDGRRLDLPLPLLPPLRAGHVGPLAGPRRVRARHPDRTTSGGR